MKKQYLLFCLLIGASINVRSQQLMNVLLATNEKQLIRLLQANL
jgi:hypothetical protein